MVNSLTAARSSLDRALKNPENLLAVAEEHQWPAGFPAKRRTMYQAVAAMTVAGWQAFVVELAKAIVEETAAADKSPNAKLLELSRTLVKRQADGLNTPNSKNVRKLFRDVGFELGEKWQVTLNEPTLTTYSATEAATVLNLWLQVRHAVAHGFPLEDADGLAKEAPSGKMRVVTGMAPAGRGKRVMAVNGEDAKACVHFFKRLADAVTAEALAYCETLTPHPPAAEV